MTYTNLLLPIHTNTDLQTEKILLLLDIIRSDEFKVKALAMGGYEVHEMGDIIDQI